MLWCVLSLWSWKNFLWNKKWFPVDHNHTSDYTNVFSCDFYFLLCLLVCFSIFLDPSLVSHLNFCSPEIICLWNGVMVSNFPWSEMTRCVLSLWLWQNFLCNKKCVHVNHNHTSNYTNEFICDSLVCLPLYVSPGLSIEAWVLINSFVHLLSYTSSMFCAIHFWFW